MSDLTKKPTAEQVKRLPKALLHDHLDGGLRPQTIIDIAKEIGHELPTYDPAELAEWFRSSCDSGSLVQTFQLIPRLAQKWIKVFLSLVEIQVCL